MITDGTVNTAVTGAAAIMPFVLPADISKVTVQDKKRQNEGFDAFLYKKLPQFSHRSSLEICNFYFVLESFQRNAEIRCAFVLS